MTKRFLATIAIAAMAASACGGGGGGHANDNGDRPSGVCETCQSDADCAAGLFCQACTSGCSDSVTLCAGLASDGGGQITCEQGSYPGGCANIAGLWSVTEELSGLCDFGGNVVPLDESGTADVTFHQNGCAISYRIPDSNLTRSGRIVGERILLTGRFLQALGGDVRFSENVVRIEGTVNDSSLFAEGEGMASGRAQGISFSCDGDSSATGFRQ